MVSFNSIASWFYSYISQCVKSMNTSDHFQSHVILDKYYDDSAKSQTRRRRGNDDEGIDYPQR